MKIVLDTNVLVSGLLTPGGAAAEVVRMVATGTIELCFDARILDEYRNVLLRPRFSFDTPLVEALLAQIRAEGHLVAAPPLPKPLPDPDDEPFLAVTLAAGARALVTRNARHFPHAQRRGTAVLMPGEFLKTWRTQTGQEKG